MLNSERLMYGIIDCSTEWVICQCHQHRYNENCYVTDYKPFDYVISKHKDYVSKTSLYTGIVVRKKDVLIISDEQYNLLIAECEKVMKAKSLLATTISALVGKLPKPKIGEEITDVEFDND